MILWIFYVHILEKPTQKYVLRPPERLFPHFASIVSFEVSTFVQNYFKLVNNFGAKLDLIKALACPGYLSYTFIKGFLTSLEVIFARHLEIPLGIALKFVFICVMRYLIF